MRPAGARLRAAAAAALLALAVAGCDPRRPQVIMVAVDTLRADRVGAMGGRPGLTPFLDELAASGVAFRNAYSSSSWTNPAVASLFTSRLPSQHHVTGFESRLSEAEETLAERLHEAGWRGIGMVANFRLTRTLGFAQGFDVWFTRLTDREMGMQRLGQDAVRYWDRHVARFFWRRWKPTFFYFHPMEPHAPYEPDAAARQGLVGGAPPGSSEASVNAKVMAPGRWGELSPDEVRFMGELYDAEVASLDRRLRRTFKRLRARGLLDGAIIVVTADHGEEFEEHGEFQHGRTLYQESARIPLIIVGPGLPAGRVVDQPVSLVDVAPTILDLLGMPADPRFEGRSLRACVDGAAPADVVLELLPTGSALDVRRHAAGLVSGTLVLLEPARPGLSDEIFDLAHDPGEHAPQTPALRARGAPLRARLAARQRELAARAGSTETAPVDAAMRERLRALGYTD